jgi:CRP-like cAMP-binding protein
MSHSETTGGFRVTDCLLLARNPLLSGLPNAVVTSVLEHGRRRHVNAKTTVIANGSVSQELLFLLSGVVSVITNIGDGHEWTKDIIGAGEVVGGLTMSNGRLETASVVAKQASFFLALPHIVFQQLVREHPSLADSVFALLEEKLQQREKFITDVMFSHAEQRIAKGLLSAMRVFFTVQSDTQQTSTIERRNQLKLPVNVKISQQELASMTGLSRESVNKQLQLWLKEGLINLSLGNVEVLMPERLSMIAKKALQMGVLSPNRRKFQNHINPAENSV